MSKDDLKENEEVVSEENMTSEAVAPKKKAVRKRAAAKKDVVDPDADAGVDAGENGRFEFSPDDESSRAEEAKASGGHSEKASEASDAKEGSTHENNSSHRKQNAGGNNRSKNANRNNDRGGKNNRNKRPQNNNKRGGKRSNARWQKKGRGNSNELDLIEFDAYLEHESLKTFESIKAFYTAYGSSDEVYDYDRIYSLDLNELRAELESASIDLEGHNNRQSMIQALSNKAFEAKQKVVTTGVLDIPEDGLGGFLVYEIDSYRIKLLNAYVPQAFIDHYGLQKGHIIQAQLHEKVEGANCCFAVHIETVMDEAPEKVAEWETFTDRVPYYPLDRIILESDIVPDKENLPMRVVDCLTPIGFGQRGLIVAPPRTGKTVLMQGIANSLQINYPEAHLIILLIDERPEEVTDFKRKVKGEVISSTFDESADSHVHAAEVVIEKARRMVEVGKDVIILLDSITRLARAYNTAMPSSGKILSGGVEANALQLPKRFFGSARNIEDGGSLTIIATALVETGSKMDEVIFEEFKGTGNMELHLDRALSDKRIFPALSMDKSGTRKEELLYHPDEIQKIYSLRRAMKGIPSEDAMEMLIQRIKKTSTNVEFLMSVAR
jgi:transcription termination factor Rho